MSDGIETYLCVGGPHAGQRFAAPKHGFSVPVRKMTASEAAERIRHANEPVRVENVQYVREIFHAPSGDISFWRPEGQTTAQSLLILLESYERAHNRFAT